MKLGIESRNKTIAAGALAALAIFLFWHSFFGGGGVASPPPAPAKPGNAANSPATPRRRERAGQRRNGAAPQIVENPLDPRLRLAMLKATEDTAYNGAGRNIFRADAEPVIPKPIEPGITEKKPGPAPPPQRTDLPPQPPPLPFKAFGMATRAGSRQVFLAKGDDVFVAKEGDVVDRQYRILKINPNSVEIQDLFTNNRQTIPVTTGQP